MTKESSRYQGYLYGLSHQSLASTSSKRTNQVETDPAKDIRNAKVDSYLKSDRKTCLQTVQNVSSQAAYAIQLECRSEPHENYSTSWRQCISSLSI